MSDFIEKIHSEIEDQEMEVIVYNIANYPADYTLQGLYDKWKNTEIIIPPFQRRFVWTLSQSSKLIESFLLGLPVPSIFLYKEKETQKFLVIDGQQRLKTVFGYFKNTFPDTKKPFYLKDVNPKWENKFFSDLDEPDTRRLKDSVLRAVIVEQLDPKDNTSIFHIFQRLNTGGTILNLQEVRNCIYQGKFNDLLKELNNDGNWRKIIGLPKPDKRMRDNDEEIKRLVRTFIDRQFRNPEYDKIKELLKALDPKYEKVLQSKIDTKNKEGLNSIVENKNKVAHGENPNATLNDVVIYHNNALKIFEILENILQ